MSLCACVGGQEILGSVTTESDVIHHTFFMGDMNYRCTLSKEHPASSASSSASKGKGKGKKEPPPAAAAVVNMDDDSDVESDKDDDDEVSCVVLCGGCALCYAMLCYAMLCYAVCSSM